MKTKIISALASLSAGIFAMTACSTEEVKADLPSPEITISDIGTDSFTATWSPVNGADSYSYMLDGSVVFATATTSATFTQLEAGQTYMFKVKATGGSSFSEWSSTEVKLLDGSIPSPVPNVIARTTESITVSWEAVDKAGAYEYRIGEGDAEETTELSVTITEDGSGAPLQAGTDYSFFIRAISNDPDYTDSEWLELKVRTEYPPFTANLEIEITDVTESSIMVRMEPNEDIEVYYATLSYSEDFDMIIGQEGGKELIISHIISNIENGSIGQYTEAAEMPIEMLRPETGYVVMAVGFDRFDRYDLFYAKTTTGQEEFPEVGDEFFDKLTGTWTGTQMGYAFNVPYATEDDPDPEPEIMNTEAVEASFEVTIVKNEGEYISYREKNQLCLQFKSFNAGELSLGYKSVEDLINMGWTEENAIYGYGPKVLLDVHEDGSMEIEGLYSDTPAYTWDARYRNEVTFMNITCDPEDSFMPSGDSLPLKVELSSDGNQLTISGTYGPGFKYRRSASAGPLWCAAGNMVLTRKAEAGSRLPFIRL